MWLKTVGLVVTLALVLLTAPLTVNAQSATKVHRLGWLSSGSPLYGSDLHIEAFQQGLHDLGYIEGQNLTIEYRYAEGNVERLPDLAAELVRLHVDIIFTGSSTPAAQPNMKAQSKKETSNGGVMDFLKFMHAGQPEWAILAIKASAEEVAEELADFHGAKNVFKSVEIKPGAEYDDLEHLVAVVQVKDNPWTIVFRSLLYADEAAMEGAAEDARELSGRLSSRAISFVGEDSSGTNAYKIFEKGKLLEDVEWEAGGEFFRFKSSLRKRPALERVEDSFVDEVFSNEGIYVPCCYPRADKGEPWLAVEKSSEGVIERADLIELADAEEEDEAGEFDDEDEE